MHPRSARNIAGTLLALYGLLSLSGATVEPDVRKVDPRLLHPEAMASASARVRTFGEATSVESAVPMFIRLGEDDPDLPGKFLGLGGRAQKVASRIYVGEVPPDAVRYLSNWPNVTYIDGAKRARRMLDLSRPALSADIVQAGASTFPPPFNASGLKGDNVYLGFVDTGLYGAHPDFHNGGTGASRVVHTYVYSSSTNPLVDEDGHGTHVAGIAAGNGFASGGTYAGMAPGAALMVGKTSFTTTDIVAAIANLIDFAESRTPPRPVAINLSLGLVTGPADGTSGFESAINALATGASGSRRLVAAAAGNEQDLGEHFRAVVGESFGTRTISLHLISTLSSSSLPQVDIWAYGATRDPDPAKRAEYDEYTVSVSFPGDSVTVLSGRSLASPRGLITVSNRVDTNVPNGATHITLSLSRALAGQVGTIRFDRTRNGGTGVIDGYVDHGDGIFPRPGTDGKHHRAGERVQCHRGRLLQHKGVQRVRRPPGDFVLQQLRAHPGRASQAGRRRAGRIPLLHPIAERAGPELRRHRRHGQSVRHRPGNEHVHAPRDRRRGARVAIQPVAHRRPDAGAVCGKRRILPRTAPLPRTPRGGTGS